MGVKEEHPNHKKHSRNGVKISKIFRKSIDYFLHNAIKIKKKPNSIAFTIATRLY
ncbi:MAG: hypothetical protein ACI8WP_000568 [Flavobacteriaceae bacterium]